MSLGTFATLGCAAPGRTAIQRAREASADRLRRSHAPVIREPTVVAFWLRDADTLPAEERKAARNELQFYTAAVAPFLEAHDIRLVSTTEDTLLIESQATIRRLVMLFGLDYPYGYVLVEPGFAEEILTGTYSDVELIDEVRNYFDLDEDSTSVRATRSGAGSSPSRHWGREGARFESRGATRADRVRGPTPLRFLRPRRESPVSAFKNEQRRVSIKRRTFHFVSYESVPGNEKRGEPALPPMWYLMGPGKRWPVIPHIAGQADAEVDLELRRWIEEQGLGRGGVGN